MGVLLPLLATWYILCPLTWKHDCVPGRGKGLGSRDRSSIVVSGDGSAVSHLRRSAGPGSRRAGF